MNSKQRAANGKPLLTDFEVVNNLLMISAVSKALAKNVLLRSTRSNQKGGNHYGGRKKTQYPRTKF